MRFRFSNRRRRESFWKRTKSYRHASGNLARNRKESHFEKFSVPRVRNCRRNHRRRGKQITKIKVLENEKNFLESFLKNFQ